MKNLVWTSLALCLTMGIVACRSTQSVSVGQDEPMPPGDRRAALQHFIDGLTFDQKGEYPKAILEYQDALRYDKEPAIYNAISKDYSRLGKHALAAEMGREAVRRDPTNRAYRENLAEIYLNAFEIDKAIEQYDAVVSMDSSSIDAWYNLARLYQMRKPLKALDIYKEILDRFGATWDVYAQMASVYSSMGKFDDAAATLRNMLEIDPSNYELRRSLADAYLRAGKNEEALEVYKDLLERDPDDIEVKAAIAHIYLLQKRYEAATDQLQSILESDTLSADTQLRFGQYFASFLQKDSTVAPYAFSIFENIRKNLPDDWRPYWFLGLIANIMKNDSVAARNFERVTTLAPANPDGWVYRASLYFEKNQYRRAIDILEEAKRYIPDEARVYFLEGLSYQRLQNRDDAADALVRALELNPQDVNTISALALLYDEMKRYADSDRLYEEALKIDPHNHLILNNYGYSLADRGEQLERALEMATEAVQQQPENSSYLDTIGWVYFKLGQYQEAERFITKAVENGDASPVVLEHLGDVSYRLNEKDRAMEMWQKALEKDPTNETLQSKISRGSL